MKVKDKIKKSISAKVEVKKPQVKDKIKKSVSAKVEVKKPEVKKVEVKDAKPKSVRQTFDIYHIETGSLASQVIAHILECNRKQHDVTMKDIKAKFGNTFYSIFCRLEERKLAHREGKLLFVHEIEKDKIAQKVITVIKSRVGANDQIQADEKSKIDKLFSSKTETHFEK